MYRIQSGTVGIYIIGRQSVVYVFQKYELNVKVMANYYCDKGRR